MKWFSLMDILSIILTLILAHQVLPHYASVRDLLEMEVGNLLIGRKHQLSTTSTCGSQLAERYCIQDNPQERKRCFICNSNVVQTNCKPYNIQNIIPEIGKRCRDGPWWQSENGVENVSIRLDMENSFALHNLSITFRTTRPKAMIIEKSKDEGQTWQVLQYFADDCSTKYPDVPIGPREDVTSVTCDQRYSAAEPSAYGEVFFQALPNHFEPENFEEMDYQRFTNLRINFTGLHTLNNVALHDAPPEIKEQYFYAIKSMKVMGTCYCYGHGVRCITTKPFEMIHPEKVYDGCVCDHNTTGKNCQECEALYNDIPWKPSFTQEINICRECNCNGKSDSCHFDPAVYDISGQISGGVCDNCNSNTAGMNCETCKRYYYRNPQTHNCLECDCNPFGSQDNVCQGHDDPEHGVIAGQCQCRPGARGLKCEQ